jgi:ligand-binding sensor domain-containing protein
MPNDTGVRQNLKTLGQMLGGVLFVALVGILIWVLTQKDDPPGWKTIRPPRDVNALVYYQDQIWSGGKDGLYRIDPQSGAVKEKLILKDDGVDFSFTTSLAFSDDQEQLWVGHQGGVSKYDGKRWEHYTIADGLPDNQILALLPQSGERIWIATSQGLAALDIDSGEVTSPDSSLTGIPFSVLFLDSEGLLYGGNGYSKEGGLVTYDGQEWKAISVEDGLAHPMVNAILESSDGKIYFGTGFSNQGGLSIKAGEEWEIITREDGLAGYKVRYLFEDQGQTIWVGSEFEGIAILLEDQRQIITPQEGLAGWEVKAMLQDPSGQLWFGTENGLSRIDKETWLLLSQDQQN